MAKIAFVSTPFENLGIEYMSSILKASGHKVDLVIDPCLFYDAYQKNYIVSKIFAYKSYVVEKLKSIKPDLVCFSIMTDTYQWGINLAQYIKKEIDTKIVFGGIHPTIVPETVIKAKGVDYVCISEGEEALLELANEITERKYCANIANIWSQAGDNIIKNSPRQLIEDLDILPFPDKELYYRESKMYSEEYFIMTSRGCNYSCAFCCNQILLRMHGNKFLRRRTVENVIKELSENRRKYGFKFVWFMDDNFSSDIRWLREFCNEYKRHVDLPFFCYAHPNNMNYEIARLLKGANCYEVAIGVESLNENTCKFINRNSDRIVVKEAIEALKSQKIISVTENILGFPGENEGDILNLIDFYNNNKPDLTMFSWLKVFPGTSLLSSLKNKNLIGNQYLEDVTLGKDKSLALGGNYANVKIFKKVACLLVLTPFLPKSAVRFFLRKRRYRLFFFLNPDFLLRFIRIFQSSKFAILTGRKITYDVGTKISLRIYRYFMIKKIRMMLCFKQSL